MCYCSQDAFLHPVWRHWGPFAIAHFPALHWPLGVLGWERKGKRCHSTCQKRFLDTDFDHRKGRAGWDIYTGNKCPRTTSLQCKEQSFFPLSSTQIAKEKDPKCNPQKKHKLWQIKCKSIIKQIKKILRNNLLKPLKLIKAFFKHIKRRKAARESFEPEDG